ncbi:MAG: hypothetical protein IVW57_10350 [Ktedonobacterales bacterium]|nr:hypothetical protein [Ktedonobacterales bacterium]
MSTHIGLIAAPKRRRGGICRAREQYDPSPVFRRARDYCEREYGEWYILSTTHGLLAPRQVVGAEAPALHALAAGERWRWAERVAAQMRERIERSAEPLTFVLYASQAYAELLLRAAPFAHLEQPLAGLGLGGRLHWYDERLRIHARLLSRTPGSRPAR